jgi:hypothetical protein
VLLQGLPADALGLVGAAPVDEVHGFTERCAQFSSVSHEYRPSSFVVLA